MALIRSFIRIFSERLSEQKAILLADIGSKAGRLKDTRISALEAVNITNRYLVREHGREEMFATLFFGLLNPENGMLQYINAGHEPVYIIDNGTKKTLCLKATGPAIGLIENMEYKSRILQLEPFSILFGYTDGVTEACSPFGEMFTRTRLESLFYKNIWKSAEDFIAQIQNDLFEFVGESHAHDDVTILAVRRRA